jgi:hypothetical protein
VVTEGGGGSPELHSGGHLRRGLVHSDGREAAHPAVVALRPGVAEISGGGELGGGRSRANSNPGLGGTRRGAGVASSSGEARELEALLGRELGGQWLRRRGKRRR